MASPQGAVPALTAYGVQVVELGMALLAKAGRVVLAPGAALAVAAAGALGALGFPISNRNHWE